MLKLDRRIICTLAVRTFRQTVESPSAYVLALLFYGFVGGIFGLNFFVNNNASINGVGAIAPWILWVVVPAMTMGLFSDEIRSGTFEQLSTLPLRDSEVVLGKYLGFAMVSGCLTLGLTFFPLYIKLLANSAIGIDWGSTIGVLLGIYLMMLMYGALGLFASSLAKHQIIALIIGSIFCTFIFMVGQFSSYFPSALTPAADFLGVLSHLNSISRGVFDLRDFVYFLSMIGFFLYMTTIKLSTRRF